jgi:hypothetical protein
MGLLIKLLSCNIFFVSLNFKILIIVFMSEQIENTSDYKSIYDLFEQNLEEIDKSNFKYIEDVVNSKGQELEKYELIFDELLSGIFFKAEVLVYKGQDKSKNIFLEGQLNLDYSTDDKNVMVDKLHNLSLLVNGISNLYGKDINNLEVLEKHELETILTKNHWRGRWWSDSKPEIILNTDLHNKSKITLSIINP